MRGLGLSVLVPLLPFFPLLAAVHGGTYASFCFLYSSLHRSAPICTPGLVRVHDLPHPRQPRRHLLHLLARELRRRVGVHLLHDLVAVAVAEDEVGGLARLGFSPLPGGSARSCPLVRALQRPGGTALAASYSSLSQASLHSASSEGDGPPQRRELRRHLLHLLARELGVASGHSSMMRGRGRRRPGTRCARVWAASPGSRRRPFSASGPGGEGGREGGEGGREGGEGGRR